MVTPVYSSSSNSSRPTYSCIRCADRKVKCDRERPCSACVKHKVECVFNPSQPAGKRRKRVKVQILADRLRHYEALLQAQGIDPGKLPDTPNSEPCRISIPPVAVAVVPNEPQPRTSHYIESGPSQCVNKIQVVHGQGRFRFVDNSLWMRVVEEYHDPKDALEDPDDASDPETSNDEFDYILNSQPMHSIGSRHPAPERIHQLWQIFIENIDPLTKVVHVPTLRSAIQKAASNMKTVSRSFEALMFAIYSAAVMSLKDGECKRRLGEPRNTLLSRYISTTKTALSRANFMGTTSLVVLQALLLHLLSVRDIYEPRAVWALTGVAIRIAQGIGLDRDGMFLGLPPFETEIRRRIWWLLKTHDFRTAELCGLTKFRDLDTGAESTKGPSNVNDDQLYPGMLPLVIESNMLTDAVFVTMKQELASLAVGRFARIRQQEKNSSQWDLHVPGSDKVDIDEGVREVEEILETKYLRYCDPSQPLHLMTMLVARLSINVIRFLTHHPRRWASREQISHYERQWVWEVCMKLLEQHHMVQTNPLLKQFAWQAPYFQQWHAFIHVLDTLRVTPLQVDAEKAWTLIGNIYENTPDMVYDTRKPIHVAVGNLCVKAYSDREAALQNEKICPPPAPEFISQLRYQREVAKAKRQARDVQNSQLEDLGNPSQAKSREFCSRPDADVVNLSDSSESTYSQQGAKTYSPNFTQTGSTAEGDHISFMNGVDYSQIGNLDDVLNMDLDSMLAQDHDVQNNAIQTITWEQWDAWLADSSVMHPLSS